MGTPIDLVALLAETEAEEKASKAVELTEEEKAAHLLLERRSKAREERATAEKARREVDGGTREAIARKAAAGRYLVRAVDLVDFFPFGEAPSTDRLPGGGVIIVRSPEPARQETMTREMEVKKRPVEAILIDLLVDSIVDPSPLDVEASALIRPFFEAYLGAATNAANVVLELGGLKQTQDKRGRG